MCFSLFMVVYRSLNTHRECPISNTRHRIRDGDGGETRAPKESIVINYYCAFFYVYFCIRRHKTFINIKNFACIDDTIRLVVIPFCSTESIISNTCHRIWDGDRGDIGATFESIISNTCHRVRDCDGCKT